MEGQNNKLKKKKKKKKSVIDCFLLLVDETITALCNFLFE